MSIRARLVVMCVVVALLPAIPLSLLVQSLIEKSFDLGLSATVEDALQSGIGISQAHVSRLHAEFEENVAGAIADHDTSAAALSHRGIDGLVAAGRIGDVAKGAALIERAGSPGRRPGLVFYETNDRSIQLAAWGGDAGVVFYKRTDPSFLHDARRVIEGRQIFAQLRLAKPTLRRSFFYPFIVIYAVILALALSIAFLLAERLSDPIRRLASGANTVAEGDWSYRLNVRSGGEIGRLVEAFNAMVSRLDAQRHRLVDMERMATWREMARHLAHEIKNPLLPIRLSVQELRDQYKGDDPTYREIVRESVRVIDGELDHLQNLVKEFSSFARMPDLAPRVESLDSLVNDVAKLYPRIPIRIETDPALGPFMFDPDQMRRVIVNLLDNAVSALEGIERPEVRIALGSDASDAVIEIADNGPGIPEENLSRVFEPYFTTRKEGSGLGLAIVKNIVLLHEGTIEARGGLTRGMGDETRGDGVRATGVGARSGGARSCGSESRGATFVIRLPVGGTAR